MQLTTILLGWQLKMAPLGTQFLYKSQPLGN